MTLLIAAKYPLKEIIDMPTHVNKLYTPEDINIPKDAKILANNLKFKRFDSYRMAYEAGALEDATILLADSRKSAKKSSGELIKDDIIQKIYIINENICISFSGCLIVAANCINELSEEISKFELEDPSLVALEVGKLFKEVCLNNKWHYGEYPANFFLSVYIKRLRRSFLFKLRNNITSSFAPEVVNDLDVLGGELPEHDLKDLIRNRFKVEVEGFLKRPGHNTIDSATSFTYLQVALKEIIDRNLDPSVGGLIQNAYINNNGIESFAHAVKPANSNKGFETTAPSIYGWTKTDKNGNVIQEARPFL